MKGDNSICLRDRPPLIPPSSPVLLWGNSSQQHHKTHHRKYTLEKKSVLSPSGTFGLGYKSPSMAFANTGSRHLIPSAVFAGVSSAEGLNLLQTEIHMYDLKLVDQTALSSTCIASDGLVEAFQHKRVSDNTDTTVF